MSHPTDRATRARPRAATVPGSECRRALSRSPVGARVESLSCCNFVGGSGSRSGNFTLCGIRLLGDGGVVALIAEPLEVLAFELGELDPVGGVADVEVKHRPDEREAAGLAGKAPDHLGAAL